VYSVNSWWTWDHMADKEHSRLHETSPVLYARHSLTRNKLSVRAHTPQHRRRHLNARKYNVTDTRYFLDDRHCTTVSLTYAAQGRSAQYYFDGGYRTNDGSQRQNSEWFTPSSVTRLHWCATRSASWDASSRIKSFLLVLSTVENRRAASRL